MIFLLCNQTPIVPYIILNYEILGVDRKPYKGISWECSDEFKRRAASFTPQPVSRRGLRGLGRVLWDQLVLVPVVVFDFNDPGWPSGGRPLYHPVDRDPERIEYIFWSDTYRQKKQWSMAKAIDHCFTSKRRCAWSTIRHAFETLD
jgi:hypothetical protein